MLRSQVVALIFALQVAACSGGERGDDADASSGGNVGSGGGAGAVGGAPTEVDVNSVIDSNCRKKLECDVLDGATMEECIDELDLSYAAAPEGCQAGWVSFWDCVAQNGTCVADDRNSINVGTCQSPPFSCSQ